MRKVIIIDPRAEECWRHFLFDYSFKLEAELEIINSNMENLASFDSAFSSIEMGRTMAIFASDNEISNIRSATVIHKLFDKNDKFHYLLRTKTGISISKDVRGNFLGSNYLLVPTYDWIKAYFEDEYVLPFD